MSMNMMSLCRLSVCTYGRVLTTRHVTSMVTPKVSLMCTRGYANEAKEGKAKEGKAKEGKSKKGAKPSDVPKVKKPRVKKAKTPIDETKPRLHKVFNTPDKNAPKNPSVTRQELQQLLTSGEKFLLVDLRTEKEIVLAGDAKIPSSVRMPIQPITHLDTYKPPKVKADKTTKGKKSKRNPKHAKAKPEIIKVESQEKDLFIGSYRMTPAMWASKYKFPKIGFEDNVVFFSSSNVRSSSVVDSATKLGYKNVKFLEGGSRVWNKYYNILGQ